MKKFLWVLLQISAKVFVLLLASYFLDPILSFKQVVGCWLLFRFVVFDLKSLLGEVLHDSRSN